MKKILLFLALMPSVLCADNLFKNSDMSINDGWKGDGIYKPESDGQIFAGTTNIVRVLKAQPHKMLTFSQSVNISKVRFLVVKFRYKALDSAVGNFEVESKVYSQPYPQSYSVTLESDGKWHTVRRVFSDFDKVPKVEFFFSLYAGSGSFLFDDITVEAAESRSETGATSADQ